MGVQHSLTREAAAGRGDEWAQGAAKPLAKPGLKPVRIEDRAISCKATAVPKWKAESEAFRAQLRNGRVVTNAIKAGMDLRDLPPPEPTYDPSFIQCPNCGAWRLAPLPPCTAEWVACTSHFPSGLWKPPLRSALR